MSAPFLIRELRWGDFSDLIQNYYGCYEERAEGKPIGILLRDQRPSMSEEITWFAGMYRRIQDGDQIALVAEADGHVVGFCGVTPRGPRGIESGHVGDLGILLRRGYRSRGIGEALLRAVLERCAPRLEIVVLSVFGNNEPAKRLYRKVGFRPAGVIPRGGAKRGDVYLDEELMYLDLGRRG